MVGEERTAPPRSTQPATTLGPLIEITSAGGARYVVNREQQLFRQTAVAEPLQGIVTPSIYGSYWTLRPDPPVVGEVVRIWGPHPATDRPRLIEFECAAVATYAEE